MGGMDADVPGGVNALNGACVTSSMNWHGEDDYGSGEAEEGILQDRRTLMGLLDSVLAI